jgi:hypothetical protein
MLGCTRSSVVASMMLLTGSLVGCSGSRGPVPETFPSTVQKWHNNTLDQVEFVEKFDLSNYGKVLLEPLDTSAVKLPDRDDNTYKPVVEALRTSSERMAKGMRDTLKETIPVETGNPAGVVGAAPTGSKPPLLVRAKIFDMDPGSQAARYWASFGAGKAQSRIHGDIIDGSTGRTLARFQDVKTSSGGLFGGGYEELLDSELRGAGHDVAVLIKSFATSAK